MTGNLGPVPMASSASADMLICSFLEMLAAERGAARNTLEAYRRDLDGFAAFLQPTRDRTLQELALRPTSSRI